MVVARGGGRWVGGWEKWVKVVKRYRPPVTK